jgi:TnpA family transposase
LSLPHESLAEAFPNLSLILGAVIDWELIREQYDSMVQYATALRLGTAEAEAILKRFRAHSQHPTYRALLELGKAVKTIFLCRYLDSEELRLEIHEGLNVIEHWNSTNRFIFFGKNSELQSTKMEAQERSMLALHLLQSCLVYINTLMLQKVLEEPAWLNRMTTADWRGVTPLFYNHINPYGSVILNMKRRINLDGNTRAA